MVWPSSSPHRDDTIGPRGRSVTLLTTGTPRSLCARSQRMRNWACKERAAGSSHLDREAVGAAAGPAVGGDLLADAGGGAVGRDLVVLAPGPEVVEEPV